MEEGTEKKKKNKNKSQKYGRGIETMYRVTMNNHVKLNQIADNKANIMISINAIIISILMGSVLNDASMLQSEILFWPATVMLVSSLITIILAVLATAPRVSSNIVNLSEANSPLSKLLFFGNFHEMDVYEFNTQMKEFQKDDALIYEALNDNFYILGRYLAGKYKYLFFCYRIFLIGLIVSVGIYLVMLFAR